MESSKKIKVLWLSPNLNHYKLGLLNRLAADSLVELCVFVGSGQSQSDQNMNFKQIHVDVPKKDFGKSKLVKTKLKSVFSEFDWVMIPTEKKNIMLFLYAMTLRKRHKKVRLFSYNHPVLKSGNGRITLLDKWLTKFYYKQLDRIVFYTEQSCQWAIQHGYVKQDKAYWANNTIDTSEIEKHYSFQLPPESEIIIVYIGRLSPRKRIPELLTYYSELKTVIPNLKLEIIGTGSESHHITSALQVDKSIVWHGEITIEADIATIMKRASLVFVPGHSGLAVNHAFSYGRPYVTLQGLSHAPEVEYIDEGDNGLILESDFETNINAIKELLSNKEELNRFCNNARHKGDHLRVENWVEQMKQNLFDA